MWMFSLAFIPLILSTEYFWFVVNKTFPEVIIWHPPVRERIPSIIRQFEKRPATAQVSSLACWLKSKHNRQTHVSSVPGLMWFSSTNWCDILTIPVFCPHIPYKGQSQLKEDTQVRRRRVTAKETVSIQEGGEDSCHLQQTHWKSDGIWNFRLYAAEKHNRDTTSGVRRTRADKREDTRTRGEKAQVLGFLELYVALTVWMLLNTWDIKAHYKSESPVDIILGLHGYI